MFTRRCSKPKKGGKPISPFDPPLTWLDPNALSLLRHPVFPRPLELHDGQLLDPQSGECFPIQRGIPSFLPSLHAPPRTRLWRIFYDRVSLLYDPVLSLGERLNLGSESRVRHQAITSLKLPDHARILDLGCGTGTSRPEFPAASTYIGLDASMGMLQRARRKSAALGLPSLWLHADAQALPLQSAAFDLVFCMGMLQHLSQPAHALHEMLRVCAPSGCVLLLDELASAHSVSRRLQGASVRQAQSATLVDAISMSTSSQCQLMPEGNQPSEYYAILMAPT